LKKKTANDKSYHAKAKTLFMPQFRGEPCAVCGSTQGTVGHHIVSQARSKALKFDKRNIIVLCPSHHKFGMDMAPHSPSQVVVERFIDWFKENRPEQWQWTRDHEHDQRKYSYKQAVDNMKKGLEAWHV